MSHLSSILTSTHLKDLNPLQIKELQQDLQNLGYVIQCDGIYGSETLSIFNKFKKENFLSEPNLIGVTTIHFLKAKVSNFKENSNFTFLTSPKVINGKSMIVEIPNNWEQKALDVIAFSKLSQEFNIPEACVKALISVESNGSGFLLNEIAPCRPKILFEGHIFYRQTSKNVSSIRPDLSYKSWTKKFYKGGSAEWTRLLDAVKFDPLAAVKSASWGLGQIMGFNYSMLGYSSVEEMVIDAHKGEYQQAQQIFNFCKNHPSGKLLNAIRNQEWSTVAYYYNGSGYRSNNYHTKLEKAYRAFKK